MPDTPSVIPLVTVSPAKLVRQWLSFPPPVSPSSKRQPVLVHRVLLETAGGRIAWFAVSQREAPDMAMLEAVARYLDNPGRRAGMARTLAGRLFHEDGIVVEEIDGHLEDDTVWGASQAINRRLLVAVTDGSLVPLADGNARETLAEAFIGAFHERRKAFMDGLREEVLNAMRPAGEIRPSMYNHLLADSRETSRNRVQSLRLFPILYREMLTPGFKDIQRIIDQGMPLVDALAERHAVPKAAIRAVKGNLALLADDAWADKLDILLQLLRDIPASWWPRDADGWVRFTEATRRIASLTRQPVMAIGNRLILRDAASRGYRIQDIDAAAWQRAGREIDEFMRGVRRALEFAWRGKMGCSEIDTRSAKVCGQLLSGLGIERVARIARRWSDAYRRAQALFAEESELWRGARWPGLVAQPLSAAGLTAHPLLTSAALAEEGRGMCNCVASYVDLCMGGTSQMWSLRSADGTRVATLETHLEDKSQAVPAVTAGQLAGPGNANPSAQAVGATKALLRHLAEHPEAIEDYLAWRRKMKGKSMDQRMAHALVRPIITALDKTLPKAWSLDRLTQGELKFA